MTIIIVSINKQKNSLGIMEDKDLKRKCLMVTKKSRSISGLIFFMVMLSNSQALASTMTDADTQDLVNSIIEVKHDGYEVVNLSSSNDGDTLYGLDNLFGKQDGETTNNINTTPITSEPTATPTPAPAPKTTGDVQVLHGTVNLEKGTYTNDSTGRTGKLSINQNSKYAKLVTEVNEHFGAAALFPMANMPNYYVSYNESYSTFNTSANKKLLASLADKYKLCDPDDTITTKARIVLAVYYGVYNNNDGTVDYNKDDEERLSRKEFYALFGKYTLGAHSVSWDTSKLYAKDPLIGYVGKEYATFINYADLAPLSTQASKADLNSNIKRIEVAMVISRMYYGDEAEKYEGQSITKYCSDIKSSQIQTYNQLTKKFPKASDTAIIKYCIDNKIIMSDWQPYLIAALKNGILTVNEDNELNLFYNVTPNAGIAYLTKLSTPLEYR
jgi:hypothetical protein